MPMPTYPGVARLMPWWFFLTAEFYRAGKENDRSSMLAEPQALSLNARNEPGQSCHHISLNYAIF